MISAKVTALVLFGLPLCFNAVFPDRNPLTPNEKYQLCVRLPSDSRCELHKFPSTRHTWNTSGSIACHEMLSTVSLRITGA